VCGISASGAPLFEEVEKAIAKSPFLDFMWPDFGKVDTLQRDISQRELQAKRVQRDYLRKMASLGYSEDDALAELEVPEKTL